MVGPSEKGQIRMNDICTNIIGMASGNVIWQIVHVLFPFPSWKNLTNKSQITIIDNCSSRTKVNLEAINASSNL
jgi:hypothetical protein